MVVGLELRIALLTLNKISNMYISFSIPGGCGGGCSCRCGSSSGGGSSSSGGGCSSGGGSSSGSSPGSCCRSKSSNSNILRTLGSHL